MTVDPLLLLALLYFGVSVIFIIDILRRILWKLQEIKELLPESNIDDRD
ncbi:MAG: hypothetical protein ACFFFG_07465 [Candidatus Thorarchaeota archaeon]